MRSLFFWVGSMFFFIFFFTSSVALHVRLYAHTKVTEPFLLFFPRISGYYNNILMYR